MQATKRIMVYLKEIIHNDILVPKLNGDKDKLIGFWDSDWCGDKVEEEANIFSNYSIFLQSRVHFNLQCNLSWSTIAIFIDCDQDRNTNKYLTLK